MAVTEKGKKYRQTMLIKFGGCEVYDDCPQCIAAAQQLSDYHRQRGKKGGKAQVSKGPYKKVAQDV